MTDFKIELRHTFRKDVNRTNEPRTCLWCGSKLRPKYSIGSQVNFRGRVLPVYPDGHQLADIDDVPTHWEVRDPRSGEMITGKTRAAVLKQVEPPKEVEGYGDYADNAFCGLRCGYSFGVVLASLNYRLKGVDA